MSYAINQYVSNLVVSLLFSRGPAVFVEVSLQEHRFLKD
jgi:hypothetical protein